MEGLFYKADINKIKDRLVAQKQTMAVAESVTAGFLQAAIASATDASKFFQGGVTAYNIGQKSRHLLIEPIHATSCNCVSDLVAQQMALHVCQLFRSDWGIGTTGYSSPVPESGNKLYCYFAVAFNGKIVLEDMLSSDHCHPVIAQIGYVNELLSQLAVHIDG